MFDLVTIGVSDREASERFYATVLAALGIECGPPGGDGTRWQNFAIAPAGGAESVTRGLHIGFVAASRAHVDAFWRAGLNAGYRDDGEPGPRPQYRHDYYGAFLLDPGGNSAEAVHHGAPPAHGVIDHLWLRVSDVAASTRFYERIAPQAGLTVGSADAQHAWLKGAACSFTLVPGEQPTRHVRVAFPSADGSVASMFDPDANAIEIVTRAMR